MVLSHDSAGLTPVAERLAPVSVIHPSGRTFVAGLSALQPGSMTLKRLQRPLARHEQVTVILFGRRVAGEVSDSTDGAAAVAFQTSPDIFGAIEAFEDFMLDDDPNGGFDEGKSTVFADVAPSSDELDALPSVDARGRLAPRGPLDGLGILFSLKANRPVVVRSTHPVAKVLLEVAGRTLEAQARPVSGNSYLLLPPADANAIDAAIAQLRRDLDTTHPSDCETSTPSAHTDDLPVLNDDGSIIFRSFSQFLFQVECNLSKGAVMAKGSADELGSERALKLVIPEAPPIEIPSAELLFHDQGRVGFSVRQHQALRKAVQDVINLSANPTLHGQPAPTPAPVLRPAVAPPRNVPPLTHRAALSTTFPTPQMLSDFGRPQPESLAAARGWYVGVLDQALRMGRDLEVTISNDVESLRLWLHRGHVVAALRRPAPGQDRLGQRLIAKRTVSAELLRESIRTALKTRRPIGQIIIQSGKVAPADVHRALRYQLLDRICVPQDWTTGWIEVGEMSPLPVKSELVAISRNTVVAHLLRRQLSKARLGELRSAMRSVLNQPVRVDLSHLLPSYRLTEREQNFFARCANNTGSLAVLISHARVQPIEAYRMLLLGTALGLVRLSEPSS